MGDTLCARIPDAMLFAKNSDRPQDEVQLVDAGPPHTPARNRPQVHTQYLTIDDPGPGMATVVPRPHWLWGAEHAVNAAGVAIGNEKMRTTDDPRAADPALIGIDLVRLAAERATTADADVDLIASLLERWGQGGSGELDADEPYWSSFLVVDHTGGWILETSGRTWVAKPVGTRGAISNRLSVGNDWTRASSDVPVSSDWQQWLDPLVPTAIADHRLAATTRLADLLAGGADEPTSASPTAAADLVAALRDHGNGPWGAPGSPSGTGAAPADPVPAGLGDDLSGITVCMHVRDYPCTTASMVASLPADPDATTGVWASIGPTCCAVLLPGAIVRRGAQPEIILPDALGEPTLWRASSQAARRSETALHDRATPTTTARQMFGPVEAAAWDQAAELTANGAGGDAWAAAAQRWSADALAAARRLVG